MRVVEVAELTGTAGLRLAEAEIPVGEGVLVAVAAASISYPDLLRSQGLYQMTVEPPYILGQQFAGTVVETPPGSGFLVGERVAGVTGGSGAAAQFVRVDPSNLLKLPNEMSDEAGAASIFNYETAIIGLELRGRLKRGESVLIHGAAGGTGLAAIQVARANQCPVIGVVSTSEKGEVVSSAGATSVLIGTNGWKDEAMQASGGAGVDVVFDPVGSDRMLDTIRMLKPFGRWVIIGFAGGSIQQVPANRVLLKNIDVVGSYYDAYVADPDRRAMVRSRLKALLEQGAIDPVVGTVLEMDDATSALQAFVDRATKGSVVLQMPRVDR